MPIIKSPVADYTGVTGLVTFVDGEGFTEDINHIEWFKEHGYEVVEDEPPADLGKTGSKKTSSKK